MKAGVNAEVVEAFDISDIANDVYEHNFGHHPHEAKRKPLSFHKAQVNSYLGAPGPVLASDESMVTREGVELNGYWDKLLENCRPIEDFLDLKNCISDPEESKEGTRPFNNPLKQYCVPSA
ncbi:tRNA (cytosine(38)-C(5))-methyltransferase 2-like [Primulina huaijiensis]|uniref:tRNA (cytosine(38)-C(5))-methyltransferase 2-like n=1 Tax=Primulina huaijiensis TaxID=1492673 RepID=UPI003CC72B40